MNLEIGSAVSKGVLCAAYVAWAAHANVAWGDENKRETNIRAGHGRTIVSVGGMEASFRSRAGRAAPQYDHPRPRLVGFSPYIAIATTDEGHPLGHDLEFEHDLQSSYIGSPISPPGSPDFVIGILDSGSDANLALGTHAYTLGLTGSNLTPNTVPIGGVGGLVDASITMPIGYFAAGLSAVSTFGSLDTSVVVGHSNVCGLAGPAINCGSGEVFTAVMGMPFLSFYNTIINVDQPLSRILDGVTYTGPDVLFQGVLEPLPQYAHEVSLTFGGLGLGATTASYFPDFEDLETPIFPTLLSLFAGTIPTGGSFFATILVGEGELSSTNPPIQITVLVDTGAQSSIISSGVAADLSLPFESDFPVDVCGVGGLVEDVPGYYLDYVKISARGGELEFSKAPFVVLDLPSSSGSVLDGILGMNFFWNRNIAIEPALGGVSVLHVSAPIPVAYGDNDVDFDVDSTDAEFFVSCVSGANSLDINPECDHLDGDEDGDVDLEDFRRFQLCYSGADLTADPNCGN